MKTDNFCGRDFVSITHGKGIHEKFLGVTLDKRHAKIDLRLKNGIFLISMCLATLNSKHVSGSMIDITKKGGQP